MERRCSVISCDVRKTDLKRTFRFIGTTENPNRMGDIIETAGWDTDNWEKGGGVVLWAHNINEPPIGKAKVEKRKRDKQLIFDVEFVDEHLNPFAGQIRRMTEAGYINSVSVSFRPISAEPLKEEEIGDNFKFMAENSFMPPMRFSKQELIELSIVPVPMHPDAVRILNSIEERKSFLKKFKKSFAYIENAFPMKDKEEDEEDDEEEDEEDEKKKKDESVAKLIFSKEKFKTVDEAKAWAAKNGYDAESVTETDTAWEIPQENGFDADVGDTLDEGVTTFKPEKVVKQSVKLFDFKAFKKMLSEHNQAIRDIFQANTKAITELNSTIKQLGHLAELATLDESSGSGKSPEEIQTEAYERKLLEEMNALKESLLK